MTQPKFAPIAIEDEIRPSLRLGLTQPWRAHRPGEFVPGSAVGGKGFGTPGPDQGYALSLAQRFSERVILTPGEHLEDVLAGAVVIALRRAALFGRAPVGADIELALSYFHFLSSAPRELVTARAHFFAGVAHDYAKQRDLAALIPDSTLRLGVSAVVADSDNWRSLIGS